MRLYLAIVLLVFSQMAMAELALTTTVQGVQGPGLKNANARLSDALQNLPKPVSESDAELFIGEAPKNIEAAITPFGYFSPEVTTKTNYQPNNWHSTYQVNTGKASVITTVDVRLVGEGANEPTLQKLLLAVPFKQGEPFLSEPYEKLKVKLLSEAEALGYIKADFTTHRVLVDRKQQTVKIYLTLDTGQRYYFGAVHFQKNPLSGEFLQRFVKFKVGQPYSSEKVNELQTDLNNSSYYQQASVIPKTDVPEGDMVPVEVYLTPRARKQYIMGLGYGTDTGPRATLGTDWRYVNQYGHKFSTMLRLSRVQSTALAKYIIPGSNPLTDQYDLNASLTTNNINQGNSQVRQLGMGYSRIRDGWQQSATLSYQIERYSFFNQPYQISHLLLPGISLQKTVADNPVFPRQGNRFTFNIIGAKEGVASDTNLVQTKIYDKWVYPVFSKDRFLMRANIGYTAIHDINQLPLSLSFFAGGSQSVRGYGYQTLGPGRYMAVGSVEYQRHVTGNWYAAAFFDVGNAFNNLPMGAQPGLRSKLGAIYNLLQRGAGVGAVWNSPVGPMELTLAQEVNVPGKPKRVQFNMGTDL